MAYNSLPQLKNLLLRVVIGVLTALALAACPSKNKGTSVSPAGWAPGLPQGTPGAAGDELVRSISRRPVGDGQEVELGLRLFAATPAPPGVAIESYVGPVKALGYLDVRSANWGGCTVMPLGRYEIRTPVANGRFSPDQLSFPWNLTALRLDLLHQSGFVAQLLIDYAEFRNLAVGSAPGLDGLPYFHTMYGQTILSTPTPAAGCYFGPVVLFFPWSL